MKNKGAKEDNTINQVVSGISASRIYFAHFKDEGVSRNLNEILYIFTFVCGFTSFAGFLGYC